MSVLTFLSISDVFDFLQWEIHSCSQMLEPLFTTKEAGGCEFCFMKGVGCWGRRTAGCMLLAVESKKERPASMDLLLLPSCRSNSDLRSQGRQLPQIPSGTGEDGEHTYSEVGQRSSTTRTDDTLYAMVGRAGQTDTPAPPAVPANTPAPPDPDGDVEEGLPEAEAPVMTPPQPPETAEYACVRKLRKAEKAPQKRDSGTDMGDPPAPPPRHAPPSHPAPPPPHPHSTKLPRRNIEAFNVPSFPKVGKVKQSATLCCHSYITLLIIIQVCLNFDREMS